MSDTVISSAKLRYMRISPRKARLVADLVRVSTRTVGTWMADAAIPYFRIGRVVRFDRTKVLQALNEFRIDSR